jgi:hypothetical protein
LQGCQVGERTYKLQFDGYNQMPYLTGQQEKSDRRGFIYFDDDGHLVALRFENWRLVFAEQKTPGTLDIWGEPFTDRRLPLFFNLRWILAVPCPSWAAGWALGAVAAVAIQRWLSPAPWPWRLSWMPGKRRRSSIVADSSPSRS